MPEKTYIYEQRDHHLLVCVYIYQCMLGSTRLWARFFLIDVCMHSAESKFMSHMRLSHARMESPGKGLLALQHV